jgi:hypothetical protein
MSDDTMLDDSSQVESSEVEESTSTASTEPETTHDIIGRELDKLTPEETEKPEEKAPEEPKPVSPERSPWKSWKAEAAKVLEKLPEETQKYIIERETQFHKGIEQYKEAANYAKTIDRAISPYKDYMSNLGVTPDVAFTNLLKTEHTLRMGSYQEKAEMLQKLAHDYQIDLNALAGVPYDPNMHNLKAQLEYTQSQLQASNNFRQSQEDVQIQSAIDEFAQSHEHFTDVQATMADLLERGFANDLDDAYAKAIRLDDNVFNKTIAQQQGGVNRQTLEQANQAAQAAKAAAVSVKGAPAGVTRSVTPASTEDAVRQAMRLHGL